MAAQLVISTVTNFLCMCVHAKVHMSIIVCDQESSAYEHFVCYQESRMLTAQQGGCAAHTRMGACLHVCVSYVVGLGLPGGSNQAATSARVCSRALDIIHLQPTKHMRAYAHIPLHPGTACC